METTIKDHSSRLGTGARPPVWRRRLQCAQLAGAMTVTVAALLDLLTPDLDGLYASLVQLSANAVAAFLLLVGAVTCVAMLQRRQWPAVVAPALLGINAGMLVPVLATSPVIAGIVVMWNLVLLIRFLFPSPSTRGVQESGEDTVRSRVEIWLAVNGPAARHLLVVGLLLIVVVIGYGVGTQTPGYVVCLLFQAVCVAVCWKLVWLMLQERQWLALLPAGCVVLGVLTLLWLPLSFTLFACFDLTAVLLIALRGALLAELIGSFYGRPAVLVLVSFVLLICLGTLLLTFPAASAGPKPVAPLDALFTSTSATCVTGLIVLDTAGDFSFFGQLVILLLIQTGGLNIMVLSAFAAMMLGRGLGLKGERAVGEMLEVPSVAAAYRLITVVVTGTLAVEAVGAMVLGFAEHHRGASLADAAFSGVFHSVSAFCNAGFALYADSLVRFQDSPIVLLTVAALITLGGLGFAVLSFAWLRLTGETRVGLALQTRIVLIASAALTCGGFVVFAIAEWHRSLAGLALDDKLVNALFQSVTARTAGFNSVSFELVHPLTLLVLMVLMFIGASPGGTGGGIKTTTAVVLLSTIAGLARKEHRVVLGGRTISLETVFRSTAIAASAVLVILGTAAVLLVVEDQPFVSLVYETVSAFGTVGLSLGVTPALGSLSKTAIILAMLIGRVGPLSLALLLARTQPRSIGFPEARIMVG